MLDDRLRRRTLDGRPLHCCCVCNAVGPWGPSWDWYGSIKDEDDGEPVAKCCSAACREVAGREAQNVTREQMEAARELEYRPPTPRKAPPRTYRDALRDQERS